MNVTTVLPRADTITNAHLARQPGPIFKEATHMKILFNVAENGGGSYRRNTGARVMIGRGSPTDFRSYASVLRDRHLSACMAAAATGAFPIANATVPARSCRYCWPAWTFTAEPRRRFPTPGAAQLRKCKRA